MEKVIQFTDVNVDGNGTDIITNAIIKGKELTPETITKTKDAIESYKTENPGEWDTDGCLDAATKLLESEGYDVTFITPIEINF